MGPLSLRVWALNDSVGQLVSLWAFSNSAGRQSVYGSSVNLSALSESEEISKSLWAFSETLGPRSVCESSVSLWDLSQHVSLQCAYL